METYLRTNPGIQYLPVLNEPNLVENVLPTRSRADLVLRKGGDHAVSSVLLRKI